MVGTSWGVDPVLRAPPCAVKDGEVEGTLGARPGLWGGPQLSSLGAYRVVGQAGDRFGPVHECEGTVFGGEPQPPNQALLLGAQDLWTRLDRYSGPSRGQDL